MKKIIPHFIVIGLFALISLAFFYPVLQGKAILQSDIVQYSGMAKERNDYRETENKESYWTNSAFGGMPTYQLGAHYPYDLVKKLDQTLRFLPRPADYLFLYFIGFYILLLVLKVDMRTAVLGAIAFGLSTYLIIILGVGHNAKAHAIAYFTPVLAGILLVFQRKYLWGGLLTAIALSLEIGANHFQMTYYLLILVLLLGIVYLYKAFKEKEIKDFCKSMGVLFLALVISVLCNATLLLTTKEYADWSTRSKSTLTIDTEGNVKKTAEGLSKNYITEYSYGIAESMNLIVPRLFGGSNHEALGENSKTYEYLVQKGVPQQQALGFSNSLPTYWGDQPIVAAPAYIGIVIFFLFVLALFTVKGRLKVWLLAGTIIALVLSWGKNLSLVTDFMIDYVPMYNKFRAVSSIQVLLELCVPALAILGLYHYTQSTEEVRKKSVLRTLYITLGILVLLLLGKGFFSFAGASDSLYAQYYGDDVVQMIVEDRKSMYSADVLRSIILVLLTALALVLYQYKKIPQWGMQVAILVLIFFDLGGVACRYVNKDSFADRYMVNNPFEITPVDQQILKDNSYYRVYEPEVGINGARTSYFHHSIGGYHAAKPRRMQELFDYQIAKGNMNVLNMLNIKYFILRNQQGGQQAMHNDKALGNAWFVSKLSIENSDNEVMQRLEDFNPQEEALATLKDLKTPLPQQYTVDSTATISLKSYKPDALEYESKNSNAGLAVFSEMYYPHGWKATIDGKEVPIYQVDYTLRALSVPAGNHQIRFAFEPEIVSIGSKIALVGYLLLAIWGAVIIGGAIMIARGLRKQKINQ